MSVKDHCGIFGIFNAPDAARHIYYGLHALQHRGQESSGIVTSTTDSDTGAPVMPVHRDFGLVLDVFDDPKLFDDHLIGDAGIGHNRYSTTGSSQNRANIQPLVVHHRKGNLALAHNGNLSNARELRKSFSERGTLFQTTSDSELILHLTAQSRRQKHLNQVIDALMQVEGAFSLVLLTDEHLIAVRDPNGFRPLALGRLGDPDQAGGAAYCVASETCAFDMIGAEFVRDIRPGEILVIDREGCANGGDFQSYEIPTNFGVSQCIFEYVYFSRPDSKIFGEMVDKVRRRLGVELAREAPVPEVDDDAKTPIVIPVPDSANTATLGYANECAEQGYRCRFELGLIRNHYVGRTFIAPGQDRREMKVRCKFNTVEGLLQDRTVIVLDDSIVRGTTARHLIKMLRDSGASSVHFRVSCPPVTHPCFYGMDFPNKEELLANQFDSVEEIGEWLGVDSLAYLSAEGMKRAVYGANSNNTQGYCAACFTGNYPVPVNMDASKDENEMWAPATAEAA
ncbi:amidophosphoribosyltransferase [Longimonas halophila]|uniref:Amidophosphoribosyltransferase n=1 Tax=Longimonas halophila TaxID=1469170 RepID=A0A2H3P0X5_9BACT|nr:amidophosphoribosyltransferase [Longimonas halophila]PEN09220.1 amidophosphoribosyltransferase [Longimonas halophila]